MVHIPSPDTTIPPPAALVGVALVVDPALPEEVSADRVQVLKPQPLGGQVRRPGSLRRWAGEEDWATAEEVDA